MMQGLPMLVLHPCKSCTPLERAVLVESAGGACQPSVCQQTLLKRAKPVICTAVQVQLPNLLKPVMAADRPLRSCWQCTASAAPNAAQDRAQCDLRGHS